MLVLSKRAVKEYRSKKAVLKVGAALARRPLCDEHRGSMDDRMDAPCPCVFSLGHAPNADDAGASATERSSAKTPPTWSLPLHGALAALDDEEGEFVPGDLPKLVVDAHVHLFPEPLFEAIWRWFDTYGWKIRYRLHTPEVLRFLLSRGVSHVVALCYAHKAGIARALNAYMAAVCQQEPRVIGLGTVFPGEPETAAIVREAFGMGLSGIKLHCHVQCKSPDDEAIYAVYEACEQEGKPVVIHAGRQPKSPHYKCDPFEICHVDRIDRVLRDFPKLKLCVPHLGADEFDAYERLLETHEHLWLDTTMVLGEYFPAPKLPTRILSCRPDRVLYGSDFPNLPYAWDRELRHISRLPLSDEGKTWLMGKAAAALYGISSRD